MATLKAIWGILETYITISNYIIGKMPHSRLTTSQFDELLNNAYDEIIEYIESYGLTLNEFAPSDKSTYINHAHIEFGHKNGNFTKIIQGQAESFFVSRFNIPNDNRFNKFIIDSYLLSRFHQDLFKYRISREKVIKFFTKKITTLHYLTIPNWRNKGYKSLISEVEQIKKVDAKLFEFYKYKKKKIKQDSKVASLLNSVLAKGKISSKTIFKLASSEKLILVYKYAEGFSDAYNEQRAERLKLNDELKKIKSRTNIGRLSRIKIEKLELDLKNLNENWITAPIGRSLEKHGFKKLFSKNDGIFFLPLSLIPEKYNGNHEIYLKNEVIKYAEDYFNSIKDSKYLTDERDDLSFIILNNLLQVDQLSVINRNRSLEISTPHLASMLMTSYFLTSDDSSAELYINDVVRNVDFISRLPLNRKTSQYLINNFDNFKAILWNVHKIDIHKPVFLSTLSEAKVEAIIVKLREIDSEVQAHQLKRLLLNEIKFYQDLKLELDDIKSS